MIDWIVSHVLGAARSIARLAQSVADAFSTLWGNLTAAFGRWAVYFVLLVDRTWRTAIAAGNFAVATGATFLWWAVTKLPHELAVLVNTVKAYAATLVNAAVKTVSHLVDLARAFAQSLVDTLHALLMAAINAVIADVRKAWTLLLATAKLVYAMLTNPVVLAEWLAGVIVQAVWRWGRAHMEALVRLALASALRVTIGAATVIERLIADIL